MRLCPKENERKLVAVIRKLGDNNFTFVEYIEYVYKDGIWRRT